MANGIPLVYELGPDLHPEAIKNQGHVMARGQT
jgi:hypothetical protein